MLGRVGQYRSCDIVLSYLLFTAVSVSNTENTNIILLFFFLFFKLTVHSLAGNDPERKKENRTLSTNVKDHFYSDSAFFPLA